MFPSRRCGKGLRMLWDYRGGDCSGERLCYLAVELCSPWLARQWVPLLWSDYEYMACRIGNLGKAGMYVSWEMLWMSTVGISTGTNARSPAHGRRSPQRTCMTLQAWRPNATPAGDTAKGRLPSPESLQGSIERIYGCARLDDTDDNFRTRA